jgi:OOP family OmpA-OmpF porin
LITKQKLAVGLTLSVLSISAMPSALAEGRSAERWYSGVAVGISKLDISSKAEFDSALASVVAPAPIRSSLDDDDIGWHVMLGYRWGTNLALEAGYTGFGKATYRAEAQFAQPLRFNTEFSSRGPVVSALGILTVGDRFEVYGRVGAYLGKTKLRTEGVDLATGESYAVEEKHDNVSALAGVGITWNIAANYAARLDYQRFFDVGDFESVGPADVDLLTIGLLFR